MKKTQETTAVDIKVRIDKMLDGTSATKAFASVTIGNAFAVHDIRIAEKDDEIRVNMPFRSYTAGKETKYADIFHPITAESRTVLYDAIKEAYMQALDQQMNARQVQSNAGMSQQM